MKTFISGLLPAVALLAFLSAAHAGTGMASSKPTPSHQDPFTQLANSPQGYWVPSPTPRPFAYYGPPPGYYGPYGPPPPYYYGPPPRRYYGPPIFLGFGFHFH